MLKICITACAGLVYGLSLTGAQAAEADKNTCLVYGINCPSVADSLPDKITKLEKEIKKGPAVYTEEELAKLKRKLKDARGILRSLTRPGD